MPVRRKGKAPGGSCRASSRPMWASRRKSRWARRDRSNVPWARRSASSIGAIVRPPEERGMQLKSYVQGRWQGGQGEVQALRDATTGQVIAEVAASDIDFRAVLDYARNTGGPALRRLTFHDRAALL